MLRLPLTRGQAAIETAAGREAMDVQLSVWEEMNRDAMKKEVVNVTPDVNLEGLTKTMLEALVRELARNNHKLSSRVKELEDMINRVSEHAETARLAPTWGLTLPAPLRQQR